MERDFWFLVAASVTAGVITAFLVKVLNLKYRERLTVIRARQ